MIVSKHVLNLHYSKNLLFCAKLENMYSHKKLIFVA